jgi:two-component system chemotaxis sensor kinase CheA
MTSVLITKIQNQLFAIPGNNVLEIVSIDNYKSEDIVTHLPGSILIKNHNNLIPLVWAEGIFNDKTIDLFHSLNLRVVIVESNSLKFGLIIDEVLDFENVDISPINERIQTLTLFQSCFVNPNNQITLLLDLDGIGTISKITKKEETKEKPVENKEMYEYMLFNLINIKRCGIPVSYIDRLEQFNASSIEFTGNIPIIRYRDFTLPLIFTELQLNLINSKKTCLDFYTTQLTCIVIKNSGKYFGLIIDNFQDIQDTSNLIDSSTSDRSGIEGSVLINDNIVTILNIPHIISTYLTISFDDLPVKPFIDLKLAS